MVWAERAAKDFLTGLSRLGSGLFHDVTITVEDVEFPCHRNVLSAYSDYFLAMFTSGMKEDTTQSVKLENVTHLIFGTILEALYHGKDVVEASNVMEIWRVASMLQITCLHQHCVDYMLNKNILSPENCIKYWLEARAIGCEPVVIKAWTFIIENFSSIPIEDFLPCDLEEISCIIQSDDLNVSNENKVIDTIIFWVEQSETRHKNIAGLLSLTRLNLVSHNYVVERLLSEKVIKEDPEAYAMVLETLRYHTKKSRRHDECPRASKCRRTSPNHNVMVVFKIETSAVSAFSFQRKKSSRLSSFPRTIGRGTSACTFGDDIYVTGGKHSRFGLFKYKSAKDEWIILESMDYGHYYHVSAAVGDYLYVLGGQTNKGEITTTVERYDIDNDEWNHVGFLHVENIACGSAVVDAKIILCGGKNSENEETNIVQCFDTSTNTSYLLGNLPSELKMPRSFIGPNGTVYFTSERGSIWRMELKGESVVFHKSVKLWDHGHMSHLTLLHDGILYIASAEKPNPEIPKNSSIKIPGVFDKVNYTRINNCVALLRTTLPEALLSD